MAIVFVINVTAEFSMLAKNGDIFEKTENKDNIIQNDVNDEDNMQSENADNFETINESQNECKTLEV